MSRGKAVDRPEHDILRELIAKWRTEAGLSQRELSAKLDRPHNYITKVENGQRGVEVVDLVDMIRTMGMDLQTAISELCATIER